MRVLFSMFCIMLVTLSLFSTEAAAKRFGGGRSFGIQRSHSSLFSSARTATHTPFTRQNAANKSRWGGILGGMLIGGLLTSLFMGHGFGTGLMTWLILGGAIFLLVNFMRSRMQPGWQSNQGAAFRQQPLNDWQRQVIARFLVAKLLLIKSNSCVALR